MKWTTSYAAALCMGVDPASAVSAWAAGPSDPNTTARTLVESAANIRKGDKVMISGRATDMPLLESIAVEVRKSAFPIVSVGSDQLARRLYERSAGGTDSQATSSISRSADSSTRRSASNRCRIHRCLPMRHRACRRGRMRASRCSKRG